MTRLRRLLIFDGTASVFRAWNAFRLHSLTGPNGRPVHGIHGAATFVLSVLRAVRPTHAVVVFDPRRGETFRKTLCADYKATRPPLESDLRWNLSEMMGVFETMGVPCLSRSGFEADDVIAALATREMTREGDDGVDAVHMFTIDKDLFQVLEATPGTTPYQEHRRITQLLPKKNSKYTVSPDLGDAAIDTMLCTNFESMDANAVQLKLGVPPSRIVDYLALVGDRVDNIPGVKGIGPKRAAKLLSPTEFDYDSVEAVLEAARCQDSRMQPSVRRNLLQGGDKALLSRSLVELQRTEGEQEGYTLSLPPLSALSTEDISDQHLDDLKKEYGLQKVADLAQKLAAELEADRFEADRIRAANPE
ncbi:MAG: hypothetical protein MHM6MM_005061 [Cercozoa sp. M6MM]